MLCFVLLIEGELGAGEVDMFLVADRTWDWDLDPDPDEMYLR